MIQLVVSFRTARRLRDLTGDPWNGRTLEWSTSSPPAPYNFAVTPEVRDRRLVRHEGARRRLRARRLQDIHMPRNTGAGVILGGLAFVLGFAMVWYIWWLAIASFGIG